MTEAGKFTHRITIEENTPTRGTTGAVVNSWGVFATVWGYRRGGSSRELNRARVANPQLEAQWVIRGPLAVTTAMRVIQGSMQFEILGIETEDGKEPAYSCEIVLNCRAGVQMTASS